MCYTANMSDVPSKSEKKTKKKLPFILRFFRAIVIFLFAIIIVLFGWIGFSTINKISPLKALPDGYAVFIHTDSLWDAVAPVIDLKVADTLLADPSLSGYRALFMSLRSSELRNNAHVQTAFSRRADVAFYTHGNEANYIAVIDMSFLSAVTRLADIAGRFLNVENIVYVADSEFPHFEFKTDDGSAYYIKQRRNLVVVANTLELLMEAVLNDNETPYPKEEKELLTKKSSEPVRIVANAKKLAEQFAIGNEAASEITALLSDNSLSVISFGITDADIQIKAEFPFAIREGTRSSLVPLLQKNSALPALLTQLGGSVQYYTLLNAGSLSELKAAAFPLIQKTTDVERVWQRADSWCRRLFSLSLEDILFSWTGNEFAVLGIEGNTDPVFVVQIKDEAQRKNVFDAIFASFAIENNTNLILGGIRMPRIDMPPILRELLKSFKLELPRPYFFVLNNYIYFSESAQNIASIYNATKTRDMLARNESWKIVSKNQSAESTVSMYYNLERSVPFFIHNGTMLSDILKLYNIGRCDFSLKNSVLTCELSAIATQSTSMRLVPGFPIQLSGSSDFVLATEPGKNPGAVFWIEGGRIVKSLELASMKQMEFSLPEKGFIAPAAERSGGSGVLWAVTSNGAVYLLDRELSVVSRNFPVLTGVVPSAKPASLGKTLFIPVENSRIVVVKDDGTYTEIQLPLDGEIMSSPTVLGNTAAVYEKSFIGSIYLINKDGQISNLLNPLEIDGIGFDSPALMEASGAQYTAFITQAGLFYLFKDGVALAEFPVETHNVFYKNAVACGSFFFALAEDAELYRFALDGTYTSVKLPDATSAREGFISTDSSNVYVCADGNVVYGFTQSLELLPGFPVAGRGIPVIADVNGDKKGECIVLSFDKKLYAWDIK